ncbi:MAG: PfkB family carbohydrate kinase [bacterium]|nr:PfkB family carbohydrate kinase [bacterium]MDZ4347332.1 PfkB family carbohydrate kinase [Candidatus Binatia bacterium]
MNKPKDIALLATFANDRLVDETGKLLKEQPGGPAFFLSNIFKKENCAFDVMAPPTAEVEVKITKDGEFGRITYEPPVLSVNFAAIKNRALIISSVLNEISLTGLSEYRGLVFIDIQGYVREGITHGKKHQWNITSDTINAISCLKATAEEIEYLPPEAVDTLKQKMLIVTNGDKGSVLFAKGKKYISAPDTKIEFNHSIGAGDTFFAYYIINYLRQKPAEECLRFATTKTTEFLDNQ